MLFDYRLKNYNFRIIIYMLVLSGIGIAAIWSATNQNRAMVMKQIFGIMVGLTIAVVLSLINYHRLLSLSFIIYLVCVISLVAVLLFGKSKGIAVRWITLPVIGQIQPSEFVKIGLILFFSWYFDKYQEKINQASILAIALVLFSVPVALILKQPNLSTSLVIVVIIASIVFTAGISYKWIFGTLAVMMPLAGLFIYLLQYEMIPFLKGYQARRILAWIDPKKYAEAYYQQENSIMAIGSGMLTGKGVNNTSIASVKNGNFLSEEQTDFIFAIIGEELGFIGAVVVIALFLLLVYECLLMAGRAKDMAGRLICTGMATLIAFQGFANIAVATGIFPNTGLPLPFVSYGVSSLLSIFIGMGFVLNVGLQRKISN
ncbi:rod shape-determining protein RodA [Clostridium sp. chh4-2]|uniref:FtsW/RodA/SpoVE family cell cycle protein n=1 Tax=Clostridium sp. chh4-2 TaxID=2067550 RepID=UPI000CCDD518|nr:FtsW/RodA/SpoVE family cell cycle protein [Clostridium sp. chh4-2]PNV63782.1 rod shape-determining protein RodA [Clostridium sp. chh4-2]